MGGPAGAPSRLPDDDGCGSCALHPEAARRRISSSKVVEESANESGAERTAGADEPRAAHTSQCRDRLLRGDAARVAWAAWPRPLPGICAHISESGGRLLKSSEDALAVTETMSALMADRLARPARARRLPARSCRSLGDDIRGGPRRGRPAGPDATAHACEIVCERRATGAGARASAARGCRPGPRRRRSRGQGPPPGRRPEHRDPRGGSENGRSNAGATGLPGTRILEPAAACA